jgi:hypothetical protein
MKDFKRATERHPSPTQGIIRLQQVPIRQLELYCTPLPDHPPGRSVCHTKTGVFFPGTPYTISFPYSLKSSHLLLVSPRTALLSGGYMWTSIHDQSCHTLKVSRKIEP